MVSPVSVNSSTKDNFGIKNERLLAENERKRSSNELYKAQSHGPFRMIMNWNSLM